jgi:Ca2+-transporting ATPase
VLFPAHIAFLELIIDPVCSIVFEAEPEEKDVMKHPPRKINEPLFDRKTIATSILQGLVILAVVAAVFRIALFMGQDENQARAIAFTTLVVANLSLVLTDRSRTRTIWETAKTPNKALISVSLVAFTCLALALYVPFLAGIFKFGMLHPVDIILCISAGIVSIIWFEIMKLINKRKRHN